MNLGTRFALSFALVGAVVAVLVGALSYRAASDRITAEIDRTLSSVTAALVDGQTSVLDSAPPGGPRDRGRGGRDDGPELVAQAVAVDGTVTPLGGRPVALPVSDLPRALAASPANGRTVTAEVTVGRDTYRQRLVLPGGHLAGVPRDRQSTCRAAERFRKGPDDQLG